MTPPIRDRRRAPPRPFRRGPQQLQRGGRHAGVMQQLDRSMRNHGVCSAASQHRIACRARRSPHRGKSRGKIPRRDRDHRTERLDARPPNSRVPVPRSSAGNRRLTHFRDRIAERLAGFAHREVHELRPLGFEQSAARSRQSARSPAASHPRLTRRRPHMRWRAQRHPRRPRPQSRRRPRISRVADGNGRRAREEPAATIGPPAKAALAASSSSSAAARVVARSDAQRIAPARQQRDRRRDGAVRRAAGALRWATGSATREAMLTAGSTIRLTNELFAPFSRSRRTR